LRVFAGFHAAYADGADHLAVFHDGHAAFQHALEYGALNKLAALVDGVSKLRSTATEDCSDCVDNCGAICAGLLCASLRMPNGVMMDTALLVAGDVPQVVPQGATRGANKSYRGFALSWLSICVIICLKDRVEDFIPLCTNLHSSAPRASVPKVLSASGGIDGLFQLGLATDKRYSLAVSMNRHTVFADIAGRTSKEISGNPRVTAAAVALPTSELADIRMLLPAGLPKWGRCTLEEAKVAAQILEAKAVAVVIVSINKDTPAWQKFIEDEALLHSQIASESKRAAGWAKASVLLTFELLVQACFMATAHAIGGRSPNRIVDVHGLELIESSIVCDTEISGEENIEVFKSFWNEEHMPKQALASIGVSIKHPKVSLLSEETEPLLLLADYAAGLGHSAHLPDPGRLRMPVSCVEATSLLRHFGKRLKVETIDFDSSYERIFKHVMDEARLRRDGQSFVSREHT
jgi:hypothetical protein